MGYRLRSGFDLPPIMFTVEEVEALVAGARMLATWGGPALAVDVRSAISKIALALPAARRAEIDRTRMYAPGFLVPEGAAAGFETVRQAITERRKLRIEYADSGQRASQRQVHPLALNFWGATWSVAAWCELRRDFRVFRLDRIRNMEITPEHFPEVPGRTIEDFVRSVNGS